MVKKYLVGRTELIVREYLESQEFKYYFNNTKARLDIDDVKTEIQIESKNFTLNSNTVATIGGVAEFKRSNVIHIIPRRIAEVCSMNFETLIDDQEIYSYVIKEYINLVLTHELIHVRQIKDGKLTEELVAEQSSKLYKDRWYEKEAIEQSEAIIGDRSDFAREIIPYTEEKQIDEAAKVKLIELYKRLNF